MRTTPLKLLIAFCAGALAVACTAGLPTDKGAGVGDTGDNNNGEDVDGDGYTVGEDCDDGDAAINPGATETCDGVDNDCDGEIDEDVSSTYYQDADNDGFGDSGTSMMACEAMDGYVPVDGDCQDSDATIYPDAEELCDGLDNDCNDIIDDGLGSSTWYADTDGDGYGDPDAPATACEQPEGYVGNTLDCNDGDVGEPVHVSNTGPIPGDGIEGWDTSDTWGPWDTTDTASGPVGSRGNPYGTVQEGINNSEDCVYVYTGSYPENVDFNGKDILVLGLNGADDTSIVGTGTGPTVTFDGGESSGAQLTGFTITGGGGSVTETTSTEACGSGNTCTATATTYSGGCVYVEGSAPTLSWLVISACRLPEYSMSSDDAGNTTLVYSMGGGAYVQNGEPSFTEVVFRKNAADAGGALYVGSGSNVTVLQSLFDANVASSGGGATTSDSSTTFTNVIFANNVASGTGSNTGGAAVDVSGGVFTSNFVTGVGNQGTSSIYLSDSASAAVVSTILMANSVGYLVDGDATGTVSFSYGDIFNAAGLGNVGSGVTDPEGSLGNISSDAMFVAFTDDDDYSDDNLHLAAGSPGTDAGSPSDTDADGTPADMGAYGGPNGGW